MELCDRPVEVGPYDGIPLAADAVNNPFGDDSAPGVEGINGFWSVFPNPNPVGDPVEFEELGELGGSVLDPLLFWYCAPNWSIGVGGDKEFPGRLSGCVANGTWIPAPIPPKPAVDDGVVVDEVGVSDEPLENIEGVCPGVF